MYVADQYNHRIRKITFCAETTETITANVCDSYTSPSGKTWTTSNTYMDTIANDAGCDSVITVNLTVRDKTTETITANVCDTTPLQVERLGQQATRIWIPLQMMRVVIV